MAPKGRQANKDGLSFTSVLRDMSGLPDLINTQIEAGLAADEVITDEYQSWCEKLKSMQPLADHQIQSLTKASNACPWSVDQKKRSGEAGC